MPRYFFHRGGVIQDRDKDGVELSSLDDARREAFDFAADTLKDGRTLLDDGGEFRVEVADASQTVVFSIQVSITLDAPRRDADIQS